MKVGIIGAGRIGKVHAKNISMFVPEMEIKTIADPFMNEQTEAFAEAVLNDREAPVTGEDGLYPVLMAAAVTKSLKEGRPVKISEIE